MADWPEELQINAASSISNRGSIANDLLTRLLNLDKAAKGIKLPHPEADERDWRDPRVGWGLVLPENRDIPKADRARADDAPEPLRKLIASRGNAPVLRASKDWPKGTIRRYYIDGSCGDLSWDASPSGNAVDCVPRYLLIAASPSQIPWDIQYGLQDRQFVGRLDLDDRGLDNYVKALLNDWASSSLVPHNTVVWSVDSGAGDITELMAANIGKPIHDAFKNDDDEMLRDGAALLTGSDAVGRTLKDHLSKFHPGLIVSTSHGRTGPINDIDMMRASLGFLVDDDMNLVDPSLFTGEAAPFGAIWFAQACCSAGTAEFSSYDGILEEGTDAQRIISALTGCGSLTAPMPKALLGAPAPLRAFVGHIEPTFNWSIQHPKTRQSFATSLTRCFYQNLYLGAPIGYAMRKIRDTGGAFLNTMDLAEEDLAITGEKKHLGTVLAAKLAARDWRSMVLLGDPTVRIC